MKGKKRKRFIRKYQDADIDDETIAPKLAEIGFDLETSYGLKDILAVAKEAAFNMYLNAGAPINAAYDDEFKDAEKERAFLLNVYEDIKQVYRRVRNYDDMSETGNPNKSRRPKSNRRKREKLHCNKNNRQNK